MSILKTLRKWVTGKSDEDDKKKKRDALRVTNYGGGAARNDTKAEVKRSIQKAEQAKEQKAQSSSAFKATPPSVKKAESKDKQTKPTQSSAFKAGNTDPKQELAKTSKERLQKQRDTQQAKKNAFKANQKEKSRAADKLKPLMDEKYSTRKAGVPTYVKQGNYAADPLVAKYNVLKHPVATSATRGAVNATTLGLSDLAISKLSKGEAKEAEQFYQANKNKAAETAGQLIGSLGMYGSTAGSFENLGAKAVGRAAETQLGKRLGAEALARTMAGTGAKAAIARSLVGDTIQDSTMGLVDTLTGVAQRDDLKTAGDYLKAVAEGQALNYGMGLAGNAVSHALPVARRAWGDFADESRRLHIVPPSVADAVEATSRPKLKTVIANDLDEGARKALITESSDLDDEWWALRESIEQEYGSINPNYRELTPEQQADVINKKTRMKEITARKNEISEDLRIVRRVEEPQNGASVDVPEKEAYNNVQEGTNGEAGTGSKRRTQAGGEAVSAVDADVSRRAGEYNKTVERVADTSSDAGRRSGAGTLRISSENRAKLTESGVTDTHLYDASDNYAAFSNALDEAKAANGHGGWVDPQSVDDLTKSKAKTYLSEDGHAGVAVKSDGDICGVFKNPASKHKGASYDLIYTARANGGTKMDCYGQSLVNRYEAVGYKPVARIPFNAEFVSDPKLLEARPDVYVLMKNTDDLDTVASRIKKAEEAGGYHRSTQEELNNLRTFDDPVTGYDDALAYRDNLLKQQEAGATTKTKTKSKKSKTAKAEAKPKAKKEPKSKAKTSIADVKTYAEFVESNKKNADVIKRIKAGENPKDIWQNARIEKGRGNIRLTSLNDAKKALYDYIPENEVQGWFNDANSGYKPKIVERIAENPDALNASLNVAYRNYLDTDPKNVMPFDEWVDTPQTYYRGTRGQAKTDDDVFSGFTPRREVAEKFAGKGGKVDEITIAPRQTYGSIMTNGESEILVPESEIKEYAKEIKTSKSDPLKTYKEKRLKENPDATFKEVKEVKTEVKETKAEIKAKTPKAEPKKAETQKAAEPSPKAEPAKTTKTKTETKATKTKSKKAEKATQESFDKDFAEFRKTIGNAKTDLYELENKLRVAESKEDKKAIREQIKKLKDNVKAAHKKAGLRYHPDRGGSDEWMAKFNEAYESFEKGGNNKPPTGKAPKPTRTVEKVEDIVNKTKVQKSAKEDVKNAMQAARRKSTNSLVTFEDENLKTIKNDPEGWKSRNASVDKTRRSNALANRSVNEGQLQADGTRYGGTVERIGADGKTYKIKNGKSLMDIYKDIEDEAAFDAYLLLRHAPDRIREGTPIFDAINLKAKNGEVVRSLNDPEVVKEEAERLLKEHPEFAQKAEEIYQYTHNELENRVRSGMLSQKKASEWMHDHPFYVPSGRDGYFNAVHGGHKGVIGADPYKAAKGSDLDIRSIKEQLAEATARNWRDITSNELLEEFFGSKIKAGGNNTKGLALLNETIGLSKSADGRKFYAKIWRDGKMHRVEIDKNFYDDLEDLYKNGSVGAFGDMVARATSKVSSPFKKLVTSWNPIFLPKNFSRDMQDALINSRQTKEFVECLKPAWDELKFGGEYARAFEDSGVSQANFVNLEEALNKDGKLGKAVDKFVALQDMTESFPRLAEYMATLKKAGVDIRKPLASQNVDPKLLDIAAANAADVTVNFSRSGSVGKNLNKGLVPFLNPSIQGWSKFVRNFREQRGLPQLLGTIAKASMLGAGTVAVNNFLLSDNPNYQQISAREKANNIIIAWPPFKTDKDGLHINNDADVFVKIPRGRFAAVYGLATLNSNNENDMGWLEMLKVARDQVLPVDPTESSIVAPLYAAAKNETWYGAPIESDYLVDNFSPSERYDERTTPLGKALGKATSGLPEELQISPKKFDYMADAATGVVGDFALPISTAVGNAISNKSSVVDASADAGVGVLKKAFTIDSATQSGMYSKYNDKATRLTHKKNSANATEADKKAADRFNSWDERVKAASNAMRYVQNSDMPNKQDAYRELAKLRNENMQKAIDGKVSLNNTRDINTIHKYAGTSYTIENLGKAADKKALKIYSAAVYGDLSEKKMREKIDSDTEFYKGYEGILKTQNALQRVNPKLKGNNALAYAVGLANAGANDDVFASYDTTIKSRTESASKSQRAKDYFKNSGSIDEFAQLENVVKTYGKVSDVDRDKLEDEALKKLQRKEISMDDYQTELDKIAYNANQSYVGKAVSLAQSGAPARAYNLYDIKDKNVQKGYNLAVMGINSRKYREMSKACDTDGNGYLKTAEIKAYVDKSDIKDKATLFDALCYYPNVRNPYGTPKQYSAKDAAEAGKRDGVAQIKANEGKDNTKFVESSSGNSGGYYGYRGYYGGRWRRWGRRGGSGGSSAKMNQSAFKAKKISVKGGAKAVKSPSSQSSSGSKATYKSLATSLKKSSGSRSSSNSNKVSVKYDTASAVKKPTTKKTATKATPPKVKFKKYEV